MSAEHCGLAALLALTLALAGPRTAAGADPEAAGTPGQANAALRIEARLGFTGTFRLGTWTPLDVTVSNRGNDLRGHLEVDVTGGSELHGSVAVTTLRRPLELPRDGRKRLGFTVFLDSLARPIQIRVVTDGRERARASVDLRRSFTTGRLILALSRDADLDYLNEGTGDGIRVLYPHPEHLPDHWQGYDGVPAVIVHGVSLESLSARQYEALDKWIAQGGILAVSSGPDHGLLRTPRLAELLPARPAGRLRFDNGDALSEALSPLAAAPPLSAPDPFTLDRLREVRGEALLSVGSAPLVVRAPRGRGAVLYLAFDVAGKPFDRWPGMRDLWLASLRLPPVQALSLRAGRRHSASSARTLMTGQPAGVPKRTGVVMFLALYVTLLATAHKLQARAPGGRSLHGRVLRASDRAAPLVFALAAYLLFGPPLYTQAPTAAVAATIEPLPGSAYAAFEVEIGTYSRRGGTIRLDYAGPDPLLRPAAPGAAAGAPPHWTIRRTPTTRSAHVESSRRFVLEALKGRDVIRFRAHASAARDAAGLRLHLTNDSGAAMRGAWLVAGKLVYALGEIADGQALVRRLEGGTGRHHLDETSWLDILGDVAAPSPAGRRAAGAIVEREIASFASRQPAGSGGAFVLAFTDSPLRIGRGSWRTAELALVLLPVRLPQAPADAAPREPRDAPA